MGIDTEKLWKSYQKACIKFKKEMTTKENFLSQTLKCVAYNFHRYMDNPEEAKKYTHSIEIYDGISIIPIALSNEVYYITAPADEIDKFIKKLDDFVKDKVSDPLSDF